MAETIGIEEFDLPGGSYPYQYDKGGLGICRAFFCTAQHAATAAQQRQQPQRRSLLLLVICSAACSYVYPFKRTCLICESRKNTARKTNGFKQTNIRYILQRAVSYGVIQWVVMNRSLNSRQQS